MMPEISMASLKMNVRQMAELFSYTSSTDENNIVLPLVLPANLTTVSYFQLGDDAKSHCNTCNADGTVHQTRQKLIIASGLLVACLT